MLCAGACVVWGWTLEVDLSWPQGQASQDFDHWSKISSFLIHPSVVFENSLTVHGNESVGVQV